MGTHLAGRRVSQRLLLTGSLVLTLAGAVCEPAHAQNLGPDWQAAAGGRMEFDTAAIQESTGRAALGSSTIPLGPGDIYILNNGRFAARNYPLVVYIEFAYKITDAEEQLMRPQLPAWVITKRFNIDASAHGNPTKDQLRLMVQSLLAEHFRLSIHYETREVPIYALTTDTGNFGPLLQQHDENSPCPTTTIVRSPPPMAPPETRDIRFPAPCGGILGMNASVPGRIRFGARNITIAFFADSIGGAIDGVERPVLDKTGFTGKYDFAIEFTPESVIRRGGFSENSPILPFKQALQEQLGLKLEPAMGNVNVPVIDHIEEPSPD